MGVVVPWNCPLMWSTQVVSGHAASLPTHHMVVMLLYSRVAGSQLSAWSLPSLHVLDPAGLHSSARVSCTVCSALCSVGMHLAVAALPAVIRVHVLHSGKQQSARPAVKPLCILHVGSARPSADTVYAVCVTCRLLVLLLLWAVTCGWGPLSLPTICAGCVEHGADSVLGSAFSLCAVGCAAALVQRPRSS